MKPIGSILIALTFSLIIGSFMTWAESLNGAVVEFHDGNKVFHTALWPVFGFWFLLMMGIASVFIIGGMLVRSWTQRREDSSGDAE